MVTTQPRKSRRVLYNLPNHTARKQISAHLAEDLLLKYNRRSLTVRKGDTVKVLRGEFNGHVGKVNEVRMRDGKLIVDGVTVETAKHQKKPRPIEPSNVIITKLDLSDPLRRQKLGVKEEELSEEEKRKPVKEKKVKKEEESAEEAEEAAEEPSTEEKKKEATQ